MNSADDNLNKGEPLLSVVLNSVALEVDFSTFRKEALATFTATVFENVTACFSCHARAEPVLTFADSLRRLVSMFHC